MTAQTALIGGIHADFHTGEAPRVARRLKVALRRLVKHGESRNLLRLASLGMDRWQAQLVHLRVVNSTEVRDAFDALIARKWTADRAVAKVSKTYGLPPSICRRHHERARAAEIEERRLCKST